MKRPPPTFVVEVRRQRRSTAAGAKTWVTASPLGYPASGPERPSGAATLLEAETKPPPAPEAPPPRPRGRILPSLADLEPVAPPFEEAAASPRRRRKSSAPTPKPKTRTRRDADRQIAPSLRSFEAFAVEPRAVGPRWRGATAAEPKQKAETASPGAKPKREAATAESLAGPLAARALADAMPAAAAAPSENATAERAGARQARHRRILERYVLGAELKPGERWKRRLQKARK
jgi:hypothetical protein